MDTELFRMPFVITGPTMALSVMVTAAAAFLSGLAVRRRIARLDLIEVLKTRE
jgi:putative ABC transport system permease protein